MSVTEFLNKKGTFKTFYKLIRQKAQKKKLTNSLTNISQKI